MKRSYRSDLRDAQVAETREQLLAGTQELLVAGGIDNLTLPRLAAHVGVSAPTVYRHFATLDELLGAFLAWMRPLIGMTTEALLQHTPSQVPDLPRENFPRFEAHRAVLEPLMESRAWNRVRVSSASDRASVGATILQAATAPELPRGELEAAAGAIMLLSTPAAWRWLSETWGIDNERAMQATTWAMRVLVDALATTATIAPAKTKKTKPRARKKTP